MASFTYDTPKHEEDESKEKYVNYKFDKYLSKLPIKWVQQVVQMFVDTAQESKLWCSIFGSSVHKAFNDIEIDPTTDVDLVIEGTRSDGWVDSKLTSEFKKSFEEKLQKLAHNNEMEYEFKEIHNEYAVNFDSSLHTQLNFTRNGNYIYKFDIISVNSASTFVYNLHGFDHMHVWYDPISEQLKADEVTKYTYDGKTNETIIDITYMDVSDIMKDYKNKILGTC